MFRQMVHLALLIWNVLVFVTYGVDKGKARRHSWRIPERTLLAMSLGLGGLGATCGGYFFHHKTRKWYFVASWMGGLLLDGALLYLLWQ